MKTAPLPFRPLPALLFIVVALVGFMVVWGWASSAPQGAHTSFSGKAAHQTLGELLRENRPHPVGSPENAVVRERIEAKLRALGYEPRVQSKLQCSSYGCCQVENVIAVRAGTSREHAVVAVAHYDSVIAGPGAADDGSGVSILLEMAKLLAAQPAPRNDVVLLFTDGEEFGLNGAAAFVESAPEMKTVRAVVNVEARGNAGPSIMFETGTGNAKLMEIYGAAVPRPFTTSLATEVYQRLPNNTDFTMFLEAGIIGFNLAFLGNASLYHSANDTVDRVSVDSLQHHGDNALSLVSALAKADLSALRADADASYFDLYQRVLVRWPAGLNLPLALLAFFAIVALALRRRGGLTLGKVGWAFGITVLTLPLLFGVGLLLSFPLGRIPGALIIDHPSPWPARAALVGAALVCSIGLGALGARRGVGAFAGWIALAVLAVALAATMPGGSYALFLPPLVYAVVGWALVKRPDGELWATAIGVAVAMHFWIGLAFLLESALGFQQSAIKAVLLGPLVFPLMSLWSQVLARPGTRAVLPAVLALLPTAALTGLAAIQPTTTPERPRGLNILYVAGDAAPPRWTLASENPIPSEYVDKHGFVVKMVKGRERATASKPAPELALALPAFEAEPRTTTPEGHTRIAGTMRFSADARLAGLSYSGDAGILSLHIDGQRVWDEKILASGRLNELRIGGVRDRPLRLELVVRKGATGAINLYHRLPLPDTPESRALVASRGADVLPFGAGDGAKTLRPIAP